VGSLVKLATYRVSCKTCGRLIGIAEDKPDHPAVALQLLRIAFCPEMDHNDWPNFSERLAQAYPAAGKPLNLNVVIEKVPHGKLVHADRVPPVRRR
jgi:hypothetical protein